MTVRHYCQGIGDCHLLTFTKEDGTPFRMLIDCGVHASVTGGPALIEDIVEDVKAASGGKIDVLVVTHEHWDHVSGFLTAAETFKGLEIGTVWMSWTEDPKDPAAAELDKFRQKALKALQGVSQKLDGAPALSGHLQGIRDGLQTILGFQFGAAGERVRTARDNASALAKKKPPVYHKPGEKPITIPGLPNLRVYVLGPPRSTSALKLEERTSEMYRLASLTGGPVVQALVGGLAASDAPSGSWPDTARPFDGNIGTRLSGIIDGSLTGEVADFVRSHYLDSGHTHRHSAAKGASSAKPKEPPPDQSWRRIDNDWMGVAADLAMQLDRGVNNTSLVLAFEDVATGRVYLFPGDAQIGSWLSWQDVKWKIDDKDVSAADLLARTVYLKVAHHGSQNATPEAKGLEMMVSRDLSAFVPTNKADALNVRWGEMPFSSILSRLMAKTEGRVIRADDPWLAKQDGKPDFDCPSGSILKVSARPRGVGRTKGGLFVEVELL